MTATATKTSVEKATALLLLLRDYSNSFDLQNVGVVSRNKNDRNGVQVREENEKFTIVCSRSPQTLNLVISRCCFADDSKEMYKNMKRMCRANVSTN